LCAEKWKNFNKLIACLFLLRSLTLTGSSKKYCSLIFIGEGRREEEGTVVQAQRKTGIK